MWRARFPGTLRRTLRTVRDRPGLLVLGVALAAVQFAVGAAATAGQAALVAAFQRPPGEPEYAAYAIRVLGPLWTALAVAFTVPLFVGVYAPARAPPASVRATLGIAGRAVRTHYRSLLGATLLADAVAATLAGTAALGWYVLATAGRAVRYAAWSPDPPHATESVVLTAGVGLLALAVGRFAVGFAHVAAFDGRASARTGWRWSAAAARRRPRAVLGFGVTVAVATLLVGSLAGAAAEWSPALAVAVVVAAGGVVTTGAAVLRLVVYEDRLRPAMATGANAAAGTDLGIPWRRLAVAAGLLLAATGGAAAVRVADPFVGPGGVQSAGPNATATAEYRVAAQNTVGRNFHSVFRTYNLTEGDGRAELVWDTRYDYDDRQALIHFYATGGGEDAGDGGGGYYTDGVLAVYMPPDDPADPVRLTGEWQVLPAPAWPLVQGGMNRLPSPTVDWQVVARNESTLVLRVTAPDRIRRALEPNSYAGTGANMTADSRVTVYVDRERAVVDRVVMRLHSRDTGRNVRNVVRYREVGTYDVERPASMPARRPFEWLWDAVYY